MFYRRACVASVDVTKRRKGFILALGKLVLIEGVLILFIIINSLSQGVMFCCFHLV